MQSSSLRINILVALITALVAAASSATRAQLPFFPGAEGYGGTFTGTAPVGGWFSDTNASVYHVTNLNDSGAGSFRNAFVENSSNKIIVFDVAGTIELGASKLDIKNLSNYYIAGQTAPGPITIYGNMSQVTHSPGKTTSNVILRYPTFRKGTGPEQDSLTFVGGGLGKNIIFDHVSASWSEDEIMSVTNNNTDVTVQYSMIHDALVSNHAYGSLIRPKIDSNVTFHHNLYANNASRQARFGTYNEELLTADFRNNVVYNWRDRASYSGGSDLEEDPREFADVNYVGNYLIAGPSTADFQDTAFVVDQNIDTSVYQSGNFIDSDKQLNSNGLPNGSNTGWDMFEVLTGGTKNGTLEQLPTPLPTPVVATQSASNAYSQVLKHVGNAWQLRDDPFTPENEAQLGHDPIDARVINNVINNTNPPSGVAAAAPNAAELNGVLALKPVSGVAPFNRPAGYDSDNDGMPNTWELAHGLNPNSPAGTPDWKLDFDNDGYVNLVEYINEVGEFPAPAPIVFHGGSNNNYAMIMNWRTDDGVNLVGSNWQPSKYDEAQINTGTVVVNSVGQHAGLLVLGANPGNNATLNITGGWLKAADAVVIGGDDAAIATLNLSDGTLMAPVLAKGAGGTFNFTGGVLQASTVDFDLTNQGGTFDPGQSVTDTHVMGDLTLSSGSLRIELASELLSDKLVVEDDAILGGGLSIVAMAGFTPELGDSWQIITADSIVGDFSSITPGYTVQKQGSDLMLYFGDAPSPILAGDYNDDGVVDAADYVVWRKATAGGLNLANETASPGVANDADRDEWQTNFGTPAPGGGGAELATVPEPMGWNWLVFAAGMAWRSRRSRLRLFGRFLQE